MPKDATISLPHGELNLSAATFQTHDAVHALSDREVALLGLLAESPNQPVERAHIAERLGVHQGLGPLLSNLLQRLRKKIEANPKHPKILMRATGGALIGHFQPLETPVLHLSDGLLDLGARTLTRDGQSISLSPQQWRLLDALCEQPGFAISLEDLAMRLDHAPLSSVRKGLSRLREKIELDPKNPVHLCTEYGHGVRFIPRDQDQVRLADHSHLAQMPLFGRKTELKALMEGLATHHRFITLLGPAGGGKTRLAHSVAESAVDSKAYPGGVVFCTCAERHTLQDALDHLGQVLQVPTGSSPSVDATIQALGHHLTKRSKTLLILDNVEHLLPEISHALADLFRLSASTRFLLTSRKRLMIGPEHVVVLEPLPMEDGLALFAHRIQTLGHPVPADEAAIRTLIERLEGSPLAILLTASRIDQVGPKALLQWTLSGLVAEEDTLKQTLQWSWELLTEAERTALIQCAIFQGGFELEMADHILNVADEWPEDLIFGLLEHSLLWMSQTETGQRLHLYESVRAFLETQGHTPDADLIQRFISAYAERAEVESPATAHQLNAWVADAENWWCAQEWAKELPDAPHQRLISANTSLLTAQSHWRKLMTLYASWLASSVISPALRGVLLRNEVATLNNLGRREEAIDKANVLLRPDHSLPPSEQFRHAVFAQATLWRWNGDPEPYLDWAMGAESTLESACAELEPADGQELKSRFYYQWAQAHWVRGQLQDAVTHYRQSLSYELAVHHRQMAELQLGGCLFQLGDIHAGLGALQSAYNRAISEKNIRMVQYSALLLGAYSLRAGAVQTAYDSLSAAWNTIDWDTIQQVPISVGWHYAVACLLLDETDKAEAVITQTVRHSATTPFTDSTKTARTIAAAVAAFQGRTERFETLWADGVDRPKILGASPELIERFHAGYRDMLRAPHENPQHLKETWGAQLAPHLELVLQTGPDQKEWVLHLLLLAHWQQGL